MKRIQLSTLLVTMYIILLYLYSFIDEYMYKGLAVTSLMQNFIIILPVVLFGLFAISGLIITKWKELNWKQVVQIIISFSVLIVLFSYLCMLREMYFTWFLTEQRVFMAIVVSISLVNTITYYSIRIFKANKENRINQKG